MRFWPWRRGMLSKLKSIQGKYDDLNSLLTSPEVLANQQLYQKYSKEFADLQPFAEKIKEYNKLISGIEDVEEILESGDAELKELADSELSELREKKTIVEEELRIMLLPKDPRDEKSVILEIRAGTGGEEAAL